MRRLYQFVLLILILTPACRKKVSNPKGKLIPENALLVLQVDMKALGTKITAGDILESALYKSLSPDIRDSLALRLLQNPAQPGIDVNGDLFFFLYPGVKDGMYSVVTAGLTDAAAFEKQLSGIEETGPVKQDGSLRYIDGGKESQAVMAWNGNRLFIAARMPGTGRYRRSYNNNDDDEAPAATTESPLAVIRSVINLKTSASMASSRPFAEMMNEPGELHAYINLSRVGQQIMKERGVTAMADAIPEGLLEGQVSTITVGFDTGRIRFSGRQYFSSKMAKLYKNHGKGSLDAAFFSKMPVPNPALAIGVTFNPKVIPAFIKQMGLQDVTRIMEMRGGPDLSQVARAFKGDFAFVAGSFLTADSIERLKNRFLSKMEKGGDENFDFLEVMRRPYQYIFSMGIQEKEAFMSLMRRMNKDETDEEEGPVRRISGDRFILASGEALADAALNAAPAPPAFASQLAGHPIGIYCNLQTLVGYTSGFSPVEDSAGQAARKMMLDFFRDAYLVGGEFEGNAMLLKGWINLGDGKTGSLKQLLTLAGVLNEQRRSMEAVMPPPPLMEETVAPPPATRRKR